MPRRQSQRILLLTLAALVAAINIAWMTKAMNGESAIGQNSESIFSRITDPNLIAGDKTQNANGKSAARRQRHRLIIEAVSFGLAYSAGLWVASVCLLASFRPSDLSAPYWNELPSLHTDTSGAMALFAAAIFLTSSEFLRLRRRHFTGAAPDELGTVNLIRAAALAVSKTIGLLATGIVIYLSLNTITHPETLNIQATHLAPWPTEGTLRVIALLLCACSATLLRFLNADRGVPR